MPFPPSIPITGPLEHANQLKPHEPAKFGTAASDCTGATLQLLAELQFVRVLAGPDYWIGIVEITCLRDRQRPRSVNQCDE